MMISNPLKKLQKNSCEKVFNKKFTKNGVFNFYYCVQKLKVQLFG
jgi:hypothetical protein